MKEVIESAGKGFTIVELMIATTVFSIVFLAAAAALIQIGKMYYKGVISSRTQSVTRSVVDTISRELQFNSGTFQGISQAPIPGSIQYSFCVGEKRYTFALKRKVSDEAGPNNIKHGLWQDTVAGNCFANRPNLRAGTPSPGGKELLGDNMRITRFNISESPSTPNKYDIDFAVIYGDDDLMSPSANDPQRCKGSDVGGQWCAASEVFTQVYRRAVPAS